MASTRRFLTGKLSVPDCVNPPAPGGTTDHSALANRDLPDQHPIEAITGLLEALEETRDVCATAPTQTGVPVGTIITSMLYAIPDGYLNCNGEVYNIADYPDLAAAFVTSFGKSNQFGGDGETTFAVPNLSDTFLYGVHFENQQMQHHIGETGGEEAHTLTIDEMPGHHHSLMETNENGTMHMHAVTTEYVNSTLTAGAIGSAGGNTAHNNLPPYFRIAYYIKY